ncbi:MAG TPA: hypothetical protein VLK65_05730 [Vicinamibacteria bacterium]|nr:hypothetical protein [Vicinamibacteria bacterium]
MAKRIAGAAVALALVGAAGAFLYTQISGTADCDVCYRPLHAETYYRIHLANGDSMDVCCPRCGLRFQEGRTDVARTEVTDFDSKEQIDAGEAFYVEGSPVHFCSHSAVQEDRSGTQYQVAWDRCLPSLIAFATREAALAFQAKHGGIIKTYEELLAEDS